MTAWGACASLAQPCRWLAWSRSRCFIGTICPSLQCRWSVRYSVPCMQVARSHYFSVHPTFRRVSFLDAPAQVLGTQAASDACIRHLMAWCAVALARWPDAAGKIAVCWCVCVCMCVCVRARGSQQRQVALPGVLVCVGMCV